MTPAKQMLFMGRVLFGFSVRRRQVKHVTTARLNVEQWEMLVETSCLLAHILDEMGSARAEDGSPVFGLGDVERARRRAIEGNFWKVSD